MAKRKRVTFGGSGKKASFLVAKYHYVWVCKKCLRVSKLKGYEHATAPNKMDLCKGKWVRRPIW